MSQDEVRLNVKEFQLFRILINVEGKYERSWVYEHHEFQINKKTFHNFNDVTKPTQHDN